MYNENNKICSDTEAFCIFLHNNAEFKKIEMTISNHKNDGISSVNRKKTLDERHRMIKKYYTERDIRAKINLKNSFLEKIFSIKNIDVYKCIYVLGFKIIIQMYGK